MKIQLSHTQELLTPRSGMIMCHSFFEHHKIPELVDQYFPKPGSNRAYAHSTYVNAVVYLCLDGASNLEDVNHLREDKAFMKAVQMKHCPSSDALGDWLRRIGRNKGEKYVQKINKELISRVHGKYYTLDIDATIIESDKGDAEKSYKGINGYQPLIGVLAENNMVIHSEFRKGNCSPQKGIVPFIKECLANSNNAIKYIRSDSAAYQKAVVKYAVKENLFYSITANQSEAVRKKIAEIPSESWQRGISSDDLKADYEVAEIVFAFAGKRKASRLVVKRERNSGQINAFDQESLSDYRYWAIITNLSSSEYSANKVVLVHQMRGCMEKSIGEIKHNFNLDHMPCGQFEANAVYFTLGILAYNIIQMMKMNVCWKSFAKASMRTIRYRLLHTAGKLVHHGNRIKLKVASTIESFSIIEQTYLYYLLSPV
jgi:hypothetical protein